MESSSEDSFLWTDASSDTCEDLMAEGKHIRHSDCKSESEVQEFEENNTTSSKQRVPSYHELQESYDELNVKKEKRKRKIKLEPDSDVDVPKKKKRLKHLDLNYTHEDTAAAVSYDNSYLDTKVKQETFAVPSNFKQINKMKRKKGDSETQSNENKESPSSSMSHCNGEDYVTGDQNDDIQESYDSSQSKAMKKKKKSEKRESSNDDHTEDMTNEDKFTADETVVVQCHESLTQTSPNKKHNGTHRDNYTFQEDSDGSGDEISAIRGDDDHDLHTTLFANRGVETETSTRKSRGSDHETSHIKTHDSKLRETKARTQKISDRIRFEEEDEWTQSINTEDSTDKLRSKMSSKVKHHLKTNTHLKPLTQHFNSSSIISEDDDIWLIKCPKDIDVSAFKDVNLKMDGKYKIKISSQSYDSVAKEEEGGRVTVVSMANGQYVLKNLSLTGSINVKKRFPKPHFHEDNIMLNNQTNFIPLPDTKCRHPLFGSNYKKAVKIPSSIAERLSSTNNVQLLDNITFSQSKKKKKHKKDKTRGVGPESHMEGTEQPLKSEPEPPTEIKDKKKKRKMIAENEINHAPKKKRIKHDPESAEAWESEKTIEENLFNF